MRCSQRRIPVRRVRREARAVLRGHSAPVTSVAYRPDGKQVATGANDGTVRIWDPATGRELALLRVEDRPSRCRTAQTAAGLRRLDAGGKSRLWDSTTGKEIVVLGESQSGQESVVFSPDSKLVAVAAKEHVRVYDTGSGRPIAVLGPHEVAGLPPGVQPGWHAACILDLHGPQCHSPLGPRDEQTRRHVARRYGFSPDYAFQPGQHPTAFVEPLSGLRAAALGRGHRQVVGRAGRTQESSRIRLPSARTASTWSRPRRTRRRGSGTRSRGSWWPSCAGIPRS